jgi:hypothetical protein
VTCCYDHPGAVVVYTDPTCPVCKEMAFVRDFQAKLTEMEQDVAAMKSKNTREMGDMAAELVAYVGRPRT